MKKYSLPAKPRALVLSMEHIRTLVRGGGDDDLAPYPTRYSSAPTCATTKFACC